MTVVDGGGCNVSGLLHRRRVRAGRQRRSEIGRQGHGGARRERQSWDAIQHALSSRSDRQQRNVRGGGREIIATNTLANGCRPITGFRTKIVMRKPVRKPPGPRRHFRPPVANSGRRADRLWLSAPGPHRRRYLRLFQELRMFWRWATWPLRCATRRSISSPERGSAAAWTPWISSSARNEQTRIVPASGPVMTKAEFKAERDMMEEVRLDCSSNSERRQPQDMLEAGVLKGLAAHLERSVQIPICRGQGYVGSP